MAIVLALISALVYGTSDYCGGRAARSSPLLAVTMVTQTTTAALAITMVLIERAPFPDASDVAWSVGAGLMSLTGILSFYEALANGAMTVVAPITGVVSAVVPVVVGITTGDRPSIIALLGVALALGAVALVSGLGGHSDRPTPMRIGLLALVAGVGFGLLFVFLDRTSDDSGLWPLAIGQFTTWPIATALVISRHVPVREIGRSALLAVTAGAFAISANVTYLLATREGLLTLVAVVASMYPATTVAWATALDGERMTGPQKVGLGLAAGAVVMVGVGG